MVNGYGYRCLLNLGVGHLRGGRALPYEVVEAALLQRALNLRAVHVGGTDGLVGLLGALRRGVILAHLRVLLTVELGDLLLGRVDGQAAQVDRVGTHVGDATALVEMLRHHHRLADGEAQLAGGFLLQRRRGEGGRGHALLGFLLDLLDGERGVLAQFKELLGLALRLEALREGGLHLRLRPVGIDDAERAGHVVVGLALEGLQLALALDDEAHGDALHAAGRQRRLHLAPQHGRQLEAHQSVEHAAGLLRVDQVHVQRAGMLDGLEDGRLRDLMEHDALGLLLVEPQHLAEVPRDGLSLAVLIACEPHL